MEVMVSCPLCCKKTFANKTSLIEHLSKYEESIKCSICNTLFTSFPILLKHLREEMCNVSNAQTLRNASNDSQSVSQTDASNPSYENDTDSIENNITSPIHLMSEFDVNTNQMYVELLDEKPPTVNANGQHDNGGEGRFLNGAGLNDNTVTIQNSDGTISFTSGKLIKEEVKDTVEGTFEAKEYTREPESHVDTNESSAEIYSCNTCGVTFSSVIDHIRTYHKNQDIILESTNQSIGVETDTSENENLVKTEDQQTKSDSKNIAKRFITVDEGLIIEHHRQISNNPSTENDTENMKVKSEEVVLDKKGRKFTKYYVQIGKNKKQSKEVVKESLLKSNRKNPTLAKKSTKKTFHQVIVKNMMTLDGSSTVQVYHCISCNTYVSELKDFQEHPCNDLEENAGDFTTIENVGELLDSPVQVKDVTPNQVVTSGNATLMVQSTIAKKRFKGDLNEPDFKCDICSTVFPSNKSLKLHRRMHDPLKIKPIEPPVELQVDGSTVVDSTYLCTVCNKMIPSSYKRIHTMSHVDQETFHCDICNKKFTSSDYLAMHMKAHSTGKVNTKAIDKSLPYSCLYCTRQFARPHEKVKHERIHTGEKPHSCEICGKTFRVAYCLTLHMRTHTGARPYACQHCGKRFKAHSVYNHHLLTHSDVRAYKCPYCPKAFKNSVQLAGHKNSHTKPFSCKDCNRPFASLYAVRCHTETHKRHNNLKFNCALCGASYARSFALNDHMKQAHNGQQLPPTKAEPATKEHELITWNDANGILLKTDIPSPTEATENLIEIVESEEILQ